MVFYKTFASVHLDFITTLACGKCRRWWRWRCCWCNQRWRCTGKNSYFQQLTNFFIISRPKKWGFHSFSGFKYKNFRISCRSSFEMKCCCCRRCCWHFHFHRQYNSSKFPLVIKIIYNNETYFEAYLGRVLIVVGKTLIFKMFWIFQINW